MNIADRPFATSDEKLLAPSGLNAAADLHEAQALFGDEPDWSIDPGTVLRLWPVIDVYGRIARAYRSSSASTISAHSGAA